MICYLKFVKLKDPAPREVDGGAGHKEIERFPCESRRLSARVLEGEGITRIDKNAATAGKK